MIELVVRWNIRWKKVIFFIICIILFICILFLLLSASKKVDRTASTELGEYLPTIVLDAGHGGEDGGAVSKSGLQEKDINLAIVKDLQQMLSSAGFRVIMTREDDCSIHDPSADTIRERKVSDLHNRLKIVHSFEDCLFISIHQNQFSDSRYSGAQMFFSTNHPESKILAECLKESVVGFIQPNNTREIKPANSSIYLLWNAQRPSVLVECGFLSNPQESELLAQKEYQQKIAFSIYCGILDYWRKKA